MVSLLLNKKARERERAEAVKRERAEAVKRERDRERELAMPIRAFFVPLSKCFTSFCHCCAHFGALAVFLLVLFALSVP